MNHLQLVLFYIFSATAVISSLIVVTNRRPAYSVLALTLTMLALSALFVLLEAYFVAVIQILIYAGAILVLFLFVIMLLGIEGADRVENRKASFIDTIRPFLQIILTVLLFTEVAYTIVQTKNVFTPSAAVAGNIEAIGKALFTQYLLPFELVSGILLIGILGVVNLAYHGQKKS